LAYYLDPVGGGTVPLMTLGSMKICFPLLVLLCFPVLQCGAAEPPLFAFGAIADCQYCNKDSKVRRYNLSPEKLGKCVAHFNRSDLSFVVHLGDFIDRDWESFDVVVPIFEQLQAAHYHVLGNHDFSVAEERKKEVPARLGLASRYYSFERGKWRFIVLDGNDVSLYAHPEGSEQKLAAKALYDSFVKKPPAWNGALGAGQMCWLREQLRATGNAGQRVILFCHFPVHPENGHNLWNDEEVTDLLAQYPHVVAWINGHNHRGNYGEKDGIHYLTLKGMVDTSETSYAIIEVFQDRLEIRGFGREQGRTLPFPVRK
jgi:manganese-dependent ADP-ribose/CDP-alcohol diphosphatase